MLDRAQHFGKVTSTRRYYQTCDSQLCISACQLEVEFPFGGDADLNFVKAPSMHIAGSTNSGNRVRGCLEVKAISEPSVAQACRTTISMGGLATKDDRRIGF